MASKKRQPPSETPPAGRDPAANRRGDYQQHRERMAQRSRDRSESGRDVGPLPKVAKPKRKAKCKASFRGFCETYFAELFPLAWSEDHLRVIARFEDTVVRGGRFALAMPRGSGKTTLAEVAAVWALGYGHRKFVVLIGANQGKAVEILDRIKAHFETNETLAEDFPEVCHPIASLERIYNRANGQTVGGEPTRIGWTKTQVVLPTVAGSKAAGGILRVAGILGGGIRGAKHQVGEQAVRPDLVISDDPQTATSARSKTQNDAREKVMKRDVLGVAGPGKKIAAIMPCTVLAKGDMADRLLDRKLNPDWQGERTKLLYTFPTDRKLWAEYGRLRAESLERGGKGEEATEFYRANRAAMDAGAKAAWEQRYEPGELSAVQHAMNLWLADPAGFLAEYNNEPPDETAAAAAERLTAAGLKLKLLPNLPRGVAPREASRVTAFIDVQGVVLFYAVVAWDLKFGGAVIDYGAFPEQQLPDFRVATASPTLAERFPDTKGATGQIYAGLAELAGHLLGRGWRRDEIGDELKVSRLLIDANWGKSTETVYQFVRQSPYSALMMPSHGKGITAKNRPMDQYKPNGLRSGDGWRQESGKNGLHISIDVNHWKTFAAERLLTPPGSHGSLGVFQGDWHPHRHQLLLDHLTSEYSVMTAGPWRKAAEWSRLPNRENHWWDCLVGAAVAASIDGLRFSPAAAAGVAIPAAPAVHMRFSEQQAAKLAARR